MTRLFEQGPRPGPPARFDRQSAAADLRVGLFFFVVGVFFGWSALSSRHAANAREQFDFGLTVGGAVFAVLISLVLFWAAAKIMRHLDADLRYWNAMTDVWRPRVLVGLVTCCVGCVLALPGGLFAESFFAVGFFLFGAGASGLILFGWFNGHIRPSNFDSVGE